MNVKVHIFSDLRHEHWQSMGTECIWDWALGGMTVEANLLGEVCTFITFNFTEHN